jgi:hypothetical protein
MIQTKINNWRSSIETTTKDYVNSFSGLDSTILNTKPNANTWSIAQVIDHVIKSNETYYPLIKQVRDGNYKVPALGKIGFIHRFLGNLILNGVEPTRKRKIKTFPIWQPSASNIDTGIIQRFQEHQKELVNFIESSKDLLEKDILISSPANKNIVYKLDKAFDILVAHERRHYNQALEILEQIKK